MSPNAIRGCNRLRGAPWVPRRRFPKQWLAYIRVDAAAQALRRQPLVFWNPERPELAAEHRAWARCRLFLAARETEKRAHSTQDHSRGFRALTMRFHPTTRSIDVRYRRSGRGSSQASICRCTIETSVKSLNRCRAAGLV